MYAAEGAWSRQPGRERGSDPVGRQSDNETGHVSDQVKAVAGTPGHEELTDLGQRREREDRDQDRKQAPHADEPEIETNGQRERHEHARVYQLVETGDMRPLGQAGTWQKDRYQYEDDDNDGWKG